MGRRGQQRNAVSSVWFRFREPLRFSEVKVALAACAGAKARISTGKLLKMTEVDVQNAESRTETVLQEMLSVEKKKLR